MRVKTLLLLAVIASAGGCQSTDDEKASRAPLSEDHRPINAAIVRAYNLEHVENAIVRQHTLYPYHFIANSAELNDLGLHQVRVLGSHYAEYAGELNVRRGDAPEALYNRRVARVREAMVAMGVAEDRIVISDGMPGGDGLASYEAVIVIEQLRQVDQAAPESTGGYGNSTDRSNNRSGMGARAGET